MDVDGFSEIVAAVPGGRVFSREVEPGFSDSAPSGRVRLDAIARWLQDVAYADVVRGVERGQRVRRSQRARSPMPDSLKCRQYHGPNDATDDGQPRPPMRM